jgi:hypothetical protein
MFLEAKFTPNQQQQNLIDFVLSAGSPWNLVDQVVPEGKKNHSLAVMPIMLKRGGPVLGEIASDHYYEAKDIFDTICEQNGVEYNTLYRMSFNTSYHYEDMHGDIHKDHPFSHNNFVLYLNDFSNGSTYLFDEEKNLTKEIKAKKNKAVFFDGCNHAYGFCNFYEKRVVMVATFGD